MYAIEFENITKEFPGIIANKDISFKVKKGTIHALIGENGAGKSTLMSILFGLYEPTKGLIKINEEYVNIQNPNMANNLGIGMVHQHFKLVKIYSNLENIILGAEFRNKNGLIHKNKSREKIEIIQKKFNLNFNLDALSGKSSIPVQQKVEIMKMLYRDNDILIFDEPTAVLTDDEISGLLETMKLFREQGKTIIFISHKLKEVKEVADTATVIRHGEVVLNCDVRETSIEQLAQAMVGGELQDIKNTNNNFDKDHIILEINNVNTKGAKTLKNINLKVHKGEILAIAGIEGNGQTQIEYLLSGLLKPVTGNIKFYTITNTFKVYKQSNDNDFDIDTKLKKIYKKKNYDNIEILKTYGEDKKGSFCLVQTKEFIDITNLNIFKRSKLNLSYVPTDRHAHGLVLDYNVKMNLVLRRLWDKTYQKFGMFKNKNILNKTQKILEDYDVRGARDGVSLARSMSGGNQQKFIVGREMSHDHDLIVIMQPTRGLDVGAIKNIHEKLLKEKANGNAILLISYELDEILALADTIAIVNKGEIVKQCSVNEITRQEIGLYMSDSFKKENEVK
ncbi:ABC transporter ATP-binding protein [Mycoplasma miroungirhinis]|uniref:ABC transporter ATP-binding protein n=1 Tax=Mycoplasma miroungirhinis TaxID=754516 RepID=A0A6M4JD10_9MOLU|nr:ABC transporter ATP-binding protein [Mycoplasma miroungirhinis]QJR44235.1 ABC transporter ATP-binding protein [Mycoplasma miroungirhinis]